MDSDVLAALVTGSLFIGVTYAVCWGLDRWRDCTHKRRLARQKR